MRSRCRDSSWAVALTMALLVAPCVGAFAADEPAPPTIIQHWTVWPKAGHEADFEKAVKAHVAWRKSAGQGFAWHASQPVVGDDLTFYVFRAGPFHWKDLDAQAEWDNKVGVAANWNELAGPHVQRMEHYLIALDTENSLWYDSEDYRYFGVTALKLESGAYDSMADALKRIHKIAKEKEWKPGYSVQWVIGGGDVDLVFVNPYRSYAEMAEPETPFIKMVTESLGSEQAAKDLMTQLWRSFDDSHYMIVTPRPDLSTPE